MKTGTYIIFIIILIKNVLNTLLYNDLIIVKTHSVLILWYCSKDDDN